MRSFLSILLLLSLFAIIGFAESGTRRLPHKKPQPQPMAHSNRPDFLWDEVERMTPDRRLDTLSQLLSSPGCSLRVRALMNILYYRDRRAIQQVRPLLSDSCTEARRIAVNAIGTFFRDTASVPQLIAMLHDPAQDVQCAVINALGFLKDPRSVEPLLEMVDDTSRIIREISLFQLNRFKDPRITKVLIQALSDSDVDVVIGAANLLGRRGDTTAIVPLLQTLENGHPSTHGALAQSLEWYRDPRAIPVLIKTLRTTDQYTIVWTINTLLAYPPEQTVNLLLKELSDHEDSFAMNIALALGETNTPVADSIVSDAITSKDWRRIAGFRRALIRQGDSTNLPLMIEALQRFGNRAIAVDYFESGQPELKRAATEWGELHHAIVGKGDNEPVNAEWGKPKVLRNPN